VKARGEATTHAKWNSLAGTYWNLLEVLSVADDEDGDVAPLSTTSVGLNTVAVTKVLLSGLEGLKRCLITIPRNSCNRRIDNPF